MGESRTITTRALNRALLARQMLLDRAAVPPLRAIERVVGLQAQQARPPFLGLWTRTAGFKREDLLKLLHARKVVRVTLMRGTLHLAASADYLAFRGALQPALSGGMQSIVRQRHASLDVDAVSAAAGLCFRAKPQTFVELRSALLDKFPGLDERAMGYVARMCLPLVTVPDDSEWGFGGDTVFTSAETWLGKTMGPENRTEEFILRYLAAFGPATVADAQAWSGLGKLKPVFDALRPRLEVYRDERKRELFDVPGGLWPGEDAPAPVRFLPGFDTAILGHADRTRIVPDEHRGRVTTKNLQVLPVILLDGFVAGTWDIAVKKKSATLTITPFTKISAKVKKDLEAEGAAVAQFAAPEAKPYTLMYYASSDSPKPAKN
jgi:hypothetical protein